MHSDAPLDMQSAAPFFPEGASLAAQLERAKEDLELVAYAISHDLKAPLRIMEAAYQKLSAQAAVAGSAEAAPELKKIEREMARMKVLMQGVLDYLNLETYGPARSPIDANEIVATALSILEEKITATGARITADPLPQVFGHRGRLTRLFVNLLDNALKFHSAVPQVHISSQAQDQDYIAFCVEDNGIGIDEEYHRIVFQLFQRLHRQEDYPGEGIGLALSSKIVESQGGKIWIEPGEPQGSRFMFTLPARKIDR